MAEREGLLAAAPLVLRFAPDRRSCAATSKIAGGDFVEPPFFISRVRIPASCATVVRPQASRIYRSYGGEGGVARGCAARPPLRSGPSQLRCNVQNRRRRFCRTPFFYISGSNPRFVRHGGPTASVENLPLIWRRGRDSNPRWAFDPYALSRGAPSTTRPPLQQGIDPFSERAMIPAGARRGKAQALG